MKISLVILISLATAGVILLAQNLSTIVQISFLGLSTPAFPLSLAMLFAFLSGGIAAALWNQVAVWLNDRLDKTTDEENDRSSKQEEEEEDDDYYDEDEEDDDVIEVEYIDR
jgi:uncharacterized integral membrane protein